MIVGNKAHVQVAGRRQVSVHASMRTTTSVRTHAVASNPALMRATIPSNNSTFMNSAGLKLNVAKGARVQPAGQGFHKRTPPQMCGIIGIYKHDGPANVELYEGLNMLQHRGQDSAGMVTTDWNKFKEYKENGLVKDVFGDEAVMAKLNAQPFFVNSPLGMYLIHNGNLTNTDRLREVLNSSSSFFNRHLRTDSDSEVLLNILADEVHRAHQRCLQTTGCDPNNNKVEFLFEAATASMKLLEGAYSCICMVKDVGLVAFRDPHGIRPLVLGKRAGPNGDDYCVASEDCAFGPIGFERVRDVLPGEMIIVTPEGKLLTRQCVPGVCNPCIFEYIYLARPDSVMNNIPVYDFQLKLGTRLAKSVQAKGWDLDLICPRLREMSVRRKLNAMPTVFKGKNVLLVDDSIVRGTTMSQIVDMVYLASASPPVIAANVYGVDLPNKKEFVANGLTIDQICKVLGADGMIYQTVEDLIEVGHEMNPNIDMFDASCFTGKYVTGGIDEDYITNLENTGRGTGRTRSGKKEEEPETTKGPEPVVAKAAQPAAMTPGELAKVSESSKDRIKTSL
eukprot:gene21025-27892_t